MDDFEPATLSQPSEAGKGKALLKNLAKENAGTCPDNHQESKADWKTQKQANKQTNLPVNVKVDDMRYRDFDRLFL